MIEAVTVENVVAGYGAGRPVVCGVTATFKRGLTVVVGKAGSGKSTLLAVVAGVHPPNAGRVWWDGLDIYAAADLGQLVANQVGYLATSTDPPGHKSTRDRWPPIVIGDDCTFNLDMTVAASAEEMIDAARDAGSIVIVATYDKMLIGIADAVWEI